MPVVLCVTSIVGMNAVGEHLAVVFANAPILHRSASRVRRLTLLRQCMQRRTRKSLTDARVPASLEFIGTFTKPEVSRLVYRYSIRPRIVSVIGYCADRPTIGFAAGCRMEPRREGQRQSKDFPSPSRQCRRRENGQARRRHVLVPTKTQQIGREIRVNSR